jgi:hypothetical protein
LPRGIIMRAPLDEVIYCRDRAAKARDVAECLTAPDARRLMLEIADRYENRMKEGVDRLIAARTSAGIG